MNRRLVGTTLMITFVVLVGAVHANAEAVTDRYDDTFRKYTQRFFGPGFDWRIFKAQAMAESNISMTAKSWVGARGIMQLMPGTFREIQSKNPEMVSIGKPEWNIAEAQIEIADARPFCNLIHFKQAAAKKHKVLVVAPLSGHHATLLRDTVRSLLAEHDVWITDWVNARMVPLSAGPFHFDDYVAYIRDWITRLSPDLNVVSVCQPTVPVLAAVSLMAHRGEAQPRALVMMGGPIDARRSPTAVNNLARKKPYSWFEQNLIQRVPAKYPGYMRRVYPGFMQLTAFIAINMERHRAAHKKLYDHLAAGDRDDQRNPPPPCRGPRPAL